MLADRKAADESLRDEIGAKTEKWGVSVTSVEIRDVAIPVALQDAMSRQAQAEREKQARVILGSAEAVIAGSFVEAAEIYANHPSALQLRAMNIIYETTKERGTTVLIPDLDGRQLEPSLSSRAGRPSGFESGGYLQDGRVSCSQLGFSAKGKNFHSRSRPGVMAAAREPIAPEEAPCMKVFLRSCSSASSLAGWLGNLSTAQVSESSAT
jgi:hypothetical protein